MKILVLLPRFPWPLDKGDKLRAYHQIVELSKKHEIYLFALSHESVDESQLEAMQPFCKAIHVEHLCKAACCANVLRSFIKREPLQLGYWTTIRAKRAFARFKNEIRPDIIYRQMIRTAKYEGGGVLDFQDALSLNTQRRMERSHGLLRLILRYEQQALRRAEQAALNRFEATTVIASADCNAITQTFKHCRLSRRHTTSNQAIYIVPNGVDTDFFNTQAFKHSSIQAFTHSHIHAFSIVFVGNMAYPPNVDAARFLVEEIMPLVWSRIPSATVLIAGADPRPAVKALAGPNVTVSGRMDDIRTAYASAKMFVAPMRIGSGMQNKLLEAMSMRLPCVTTSLAAAPLGATAWEHLLVGDSAEQIADLIVKLGIEELHDSIADGGHRFVQEHYSWQAAVEPLEHILNAQLESK